MKKLSNLIILLGILIILSPYIIKKYEDYRSQQILKALEMEMIILEEANYRLDDFNQEAIDSDSIYNSLGTHDNSPTETSTEVQSNEAKSQGKEKTIIKIEKINLKLPVFSGVNDKNLKYGAASFRGDIDPGNIGNYSLAGHRSYTYGRMFNRLNEIEKGDIIEIIHNSKKFVYKVMDTFIVNPQDTWVLNNEEDKKLITLVTCHPIRIANQRLIVKGELVE